MDKEDFIKQFKNDTSKTTVMDIVYGELVEYCRRKDIDEDDLSTSELESIARRMIREGDF